ncbi:MAG: hypothetical protein QOK71_08555 [Nitrososphaeraceae archaeon]|nr:hypothetical protein [Nitrososphaeraceae archaeon]
MMQKATVSERRTVPKQQVIIALPFFYFTMALQYLQILISKIIID